jgi:hypothetical protein
MALIELDDEILGIIERQRGDVDIDFFILNLLLDALEKRLEEK